MVRITAVTAWSWAKNECVVVVGGQEVSAPLPPFASPIVEYDVQVADGRITEWTRKPPVLDPDDARVLEALQGAPEDAKDACRALFSLPSGAGAGDILQRARMQDVQVASALGHWQGVFDGLALSEAQRLLLLDNYCCYGRAEKRRTKRPLPTVLAVESDPPEAQFQDFSRSPDVSKRRLAGVVPVWRAVRLARAAGCLLSKQYVASSYGIQAASALESDTDAFTLASPPPRPQLLKATGRHAVVSQGASARTMFDKAPGEAPGETHWFASCFGSALAHPGGVKFLKTSPEARLVKAYALHEQRGSVYVSSCTAGSAFVPDPVPTGGLHFVGHPTAAEGGCALFKPGLRSVGVFCPQGNGSTWTRGLLEQVVALLQPGGVVFTNCGDVRFLDFVT